MSEQPAPDRDYTLRALAEAVARITARHGDLEPPGRDQAVADADLALVLEVWVTALLAALPAERVGRILGRLGLYAAGQQQP